MICLLLLFYTVESLWRERQTRLAAISLATPVRTGSVLLGKALANGLVAVVVVLVEFAAAAGFLLYQGKVGVELWPFVLVWGVLLVPTVWAWTAFVMATLSLTRNRYTTYAVCLAALIFTGYRLVSGKMNWVGNWPLFGAVEWSDISVLEFDRAALWLNRVFVLGLAVLFTALTARFYARRDLDPSRPGPPAPARPPCSGRRSGSCRWPSCRWPPGRPLGEGRPRLPGGGDQAARERLLAEEPGDLPRLAAARHHGRRRRRRPRPAARAAQGRRGRTTWSTTRTSRCGRSRSPAGLHWESPALDPATARTSQPDNRAGLYVFTPPAPLAPGANGPARLHVRGGVPRRHPEAGGRHERVHPPLGRGPHQLRHQLRAGARVLRARSGSTRTTSTSRRNTPTTSIAGQTESVPRQPDAVPRRGSRSPARPTSPGTRWGPSTSDTVKDGLPHDRLGERPSGQLLQHRRRPLGGPPRRRGPPSTTTRRTPTTSTEMVEALDAARKYYSDWFRPYPWRELKLSEFPALASYAQGFPTDITFSESIGFLTRERPQGQRGLHGHRARGRAPVVGQHGRARQGAGRQPALGGDRALLDAAPVRAGQGPSRPRSSSPRRSRTATPRAARPTPSGRSSRPTAPATATRP